MSKRRGTDLFYEDGQRASWDAIRRHVLNEQPLCVLCGDPSAEVDHVWPRFYGGDDVRSNLQGLCVPCNRAKANRVEPDNATAPQLYAAAQSILARSEAALTDLVRFVIPLIGEAVVHPTALERGRLSAIKDHAAVVCYQADQIRDLVAEWTSILNAECEVTV